MKKFVFYFRLVDFPDWAGKGRIYATPVYNAPEYIRVTEIYKSNPIADGHGWEWLHLSVWEAGALRAGTYLIHRAHAVVLRLSQDTCHLRHPEWQSLANYAEIKYLKNI